MENQVLNTAENLELSELEVNQIGQVVLPGPLKEKKAKAVKAKAEKKTRVKKDPADTTNFDLKTATQTSISDIVAFLNMFKGVKDSYKVNTYSNELKVTFAKLTPEQVLSQIGDSKNEIEFEVKKNSFCLKLY